MTALITYHHARHDGCRRCRVLGARSAASASLSGRVRTSVRAGIWILASTSFLAVALLGWWTPDPLDGGNLLGVAVHQVSTFRHGGTASRWIPAGFVMRPYRPDSALRVPWPARISAHSYATRRCRLAETAEGQRVNDRRTPWCGSLPP